MKTFYLTGDRSIDPANAVAIVGKAVAQLHFENKGEELAFVTGTEPGGVEFAARFIIPTGALTVIERPKAPEGWTNWDKSHATIEPTVDAAVVLHGDPLASRIGKSVSDNFPPEKIRFLIQESEGK